MNDLRTAAQQALEALEYEAERGNDDGYRKERDALRAALAEPVQEPVECEPQYANEDGWCDWVCPKPQGYLMQCCDCDLIHEVESRVAKYQPRPSEEFEVVDDPDLQVQWRMKRRDDISPKQPVQEPVAWMHTNAVGHVYFRKKPQDRVFNPQPLYTAPPQRKPLTEGELSKIIDAEIGFNSCVGWEEGFARAIERAHGIGE